MSSDQPTVEIKVRDNGPYKVTGAVTLIDADGTRFDLPEVPVVIEGFAPDPVALLPVTYRTPDPAAAV